MLIRLDDADAQSALLRTESDLSDAKLEIVEAERAIARNKDELAAAVEQEAFEAPRELRQQDLQQRGVIAPPPRSRRQSCYLSKTICSVASQWFGSIKRLFNQAKTRLARAELANNDALVI